MVTSRESFATQTQESLQKLQQAISQMPDVAATLKDQCHEIEGSELEDAAEVDASRQLLDNLRSQWRELVIELESTKSELEYYREQTKSPCES